MISQANKGDTGKFQSRTLCCRRRNMCVVIQSVSWKSNTPDHSFTRRLTFFASRRFFRFLWKITCKLFWCCNCNSRKAVTQGQILSPLHREFVGKCSINMYLVLTQNPQKWIYSLLPWDTRNVANFTVHNFNITYCDYTCVHCDYTSVNCDYTSVYCDYTSVLSLRMTIARLSVQIMILAVPWTVTWRWQRTPGRTQSSLTSWYKRETRWL